MTQSEFQQKFSRTEWDLGIEPVRGLRVWKWQDGTFTGAAGLVGQNSHHWKPGENVAECQRAVMGFYVHQRQIGTFTYDEPPHDKCSVVEPGCTCGFYAYWDVPVVDQSPFRIVGLVEGHGRVVIGEKGFRCQKATILAVATGQTGKAHDRLAASITIMYPEVQVFRRVVDMLAEFPPSEPPEVEEPEEEPRRDADVYAQMVQRLNAAKMIRSMTASTWVPGGVVSSPQSSAIAGLEDTIAALREPPRRDRASLVLAGSQVALCAVLAVLWVVIAVSDDAMWKLAIAALWAAAGGFWAKILRSELRGDA